ncbi:MAG: gliding motility protein GldN [Bacteroidota bacterium]
MKKLLLTTVAFAGLALTVLAQNVNVNANVTINTGSGSGSGNPSVNRTPPDSGGVSDAPNDRVWKKDHIKQRNEIPYAYLREADVFWAKRMWRTLDLREKINHPFYYPDIPMAEKKSIAQLLWNAVTVEGALTAYSDEEFTKKLTVAEVLAANSFVDTVTIPSPNDPDRDTTMIIAREFKTADVKKLLIKEDWFFDKQRSVQDVRILGICMIIDKYTEDPATGEKVYKGPVGLFWINFPEARPIFAKTDVFNRFNDAERRSYDDIFWKRLFGSYIVQESNVYNRPISDYQKGFDALLEADKIKMDIFKIEHDLWEY